MMRTEAFHIRGITPLLMSNPRGCNPLDPMTKKRKLITSKRKKTDEDYEDLLRMDFETGIYIDAKGPYIPGHMIEGCLREAAKASKRGKAVQAASQVIEEHIPLIYKGPKDIQGLWNEEFFDIRHVVVNKSKTMKCRPFFREWALKFSVCWDDSVLDNGELRRILAEGGRMKCIGDYRPRYGQFEVVA